MQSLGWSWFCVWGLCVGVMLYRLVQTAPVTVNVRTAHPGRSEFRCSVHLYAMRSKWAHPRLLRAPPTTTNQHSRPPDRISEPNQCEAHHAASETLSSLCRVVRCVSTLSSSSPLSPVVVGAEKPLRRSFHLGERVKVFRKTMMFSVNCEDYERCARFALCV